VLEHSLLQARLRDKNLLQQDMNAPLLTLVWYCNLKFSNMHTTFIKEGFLLKLHMCTEPHLVEYVTLIGFITWNVCFRVRYVIWVILLDQHEDLHNLWHSQPSHSFFFFF
jgi:hypothetical protein